MRVVKYVKNHLRSVSFEIQFRSDMSKTLYPAMTTRFNMPESGRSMLEMLGVLVIIAVLAIGGIIGYSYAVDKYKTNDTLEEITRRQFVLSAQYSTSKTLNQDEFGTTTRHGYPISVALRDQNLGGYEVNLSTVSQGVCKQILKSNYPALIRVNGKYANETGYVCNELNEVSFIFVEGGSWCIYMNDQGNCCDEQGRCCPKDKPLVNAAGHCVSCNDTQTTDVQSHADTCARCPNRHMVQYPHAQYCAKDCPLGEYADSYGNCIKCDQVLQVAIDGSNDNHARLLKCPKMVLQTQNLAIHCDIADRAFDVKNYPELCAKCSNRVLQGTQCVLK